MKSDTTSIHLDRGKPAPRSAHTSYLNVKMLLSVYRLQCLSTLKVVEAGLTLAFAHCLEMPRAFGASQIHYFFFLKSLFALVLEDGLELFS